MQKFIALLLTIALLLLALAGCAEKSENEAQDDKQETAEYADLEDALVGETKSIAKQVANFATKENASLFTQSEEIINLVCTFADDVRSNKTPSAAKRYTLTPGERDSSTPKALSDEEFLAACVSVFPNYVNARYGTSVVAASSILNYSCVYPLPADFRSTQVIELKYSSQVSVFAVYSKSDSGTLICSVYPLFHLDEEGLDFEETASSGELGMNIKCKANDCSAKASDSLLDCEPDNDYEVFRSKNLEVDLAQEVAPAIAKKANESYLKYVSCPEECYNYAFMYEDIKRFEPVGAIVWSANDLTDFYGMESKNTNKLLSTRLVNSFASLICGNYGGNTMLAAQAIISATDSFRVKGSVDPSIVWLLYEHDDSYMTVSVSIVPCSDDCVTVTASPMWSLDLVANTFGYYIDGADSENYSYLADWFTSGKYVDLT